MTAIWTLGGQLPRNSRPLPPETYAYNHRALVLNVGCARTLP